MSRNKGQGTDLERRARNDFRNEGFDAMYLRTGEDGDIGDVWVNRPPLGLARRVAVLLWKRLWPLEPGQKRRRPKGEPLVWVLDYETGKRLLAAYLDSDEGRDVQLVIECKAAQALSVTTELADAKSAAGHTGLDYGGLVCDG